MLVTPRGSLSGLKVISNMLTFFAASGVSGPIPLPKFVQLEVRLELQGSGMSNSCTLVQCSGMLAANGKNIHLCYSVLPILVATH